MSNNRKLIFVLCFIVAALSMLHVIIGSAKTPEGMVYLWTGHYYLDYFYYLTPIAQGSRGVLSAFSQAATDDPTRFIHLWPYTSIGFIGGLLRFTPVAIYWGSIFALSFLLAFLIYKTIEKILENESIANKIGAFLLALFAAPFFILKLNGSLLDINLYDFWYSNSTFFRRFEPIPHHLLSSVLILVSFLKTAGLIQNLNKLTVKKVILNSLSVGFLTSAVLSFNSFNMLVPFAAISLTAVLYLFFNLLKKEFKNVISLIIFLAVSVGMFLITGFALRSYYANTMFAAVFKTVESALHQNTTLKTVILSHGPLIIIALFGLFAFFKKMSSLRMLLLVFFILSYGIYSTNLDKMLGTHNGRFLSPLNYILLGSLAVLAIKKIKFNYLIIILILLYSLPVNLKVFRDTLNDRNISSPISYLPTGITEGFNFLEKYPGKGDVLMTPSQFLGTVLPVFVDRKVYVARHIVTPNYIEKNMRASNFYLGAMTHEEAGNFLQKNGLNFVILTSIEGYNVQTLFEYPFLKEIFKNKDIIIFEVDIK